MHFFTIEAGLQLLLVTCIPWIDVRRGVNGLTLTSSVESEGRHVSVCPHTNITFTCTATQVAFLLWLAPPLLDALDMAVFSPSDSEQSRVIDDIITIYVAPVHNHMGNLADFTSTLNILVDGVGNGTSVTCKTNFENIMKSLLVYKKGTPLEPINVTTVVDDFMTENFSIVLSWEMQEPEPDTYTYRISVNTSAQPVHTNMTTIALEGEYNMPLDITITAMNCVGTSEEVTEVVHVAGCSPPTAPVNGNVSEFTSSRVGAQVTYHCDTDLVLVGERVATCSSPSLQWLPSSEEVMCVQLPVECGHPSELLQSGVSVHGTTNNSVITFSCEPGYSLHGSTTSQCVSGEWTPSPQTVMCIANTSPPTDSTNTTVTTSGPGSPTSDSSTTPVGLIAAPVVVIGAAVIVLIVVIVIVVVLYRHSSNLRKNPLGANENTYGEQELLAVMPDSSTSSGGLPSPQPLSGPSYDTVTTDNATAFTISQNSTVTAPPQLYSEANNRKRKVELSDDRMATSHRNNDAAEYSTPRELSKARKPPQKYTDVVVEQKRALSPLSLADQAVQYSEIQPSHHPPAPTRPPKPSARSPPPAPYSLPLQGGDKHPLDKNISIDKVIQQLQELAPHWRALGEAAHIQPAILEKIAAHFKENEIDSFIEVMNQYFIPNKTRWADVAAVCEKAGFMDMSDALLGAYDTGFLPVQIEEEEEEVRPPPSKPGPPIPPRSSEGDDEDTPPTLPPPLAPENVFDMAPAHRKPPALPSSDQSPPPRPPKSHKPPARPPRQ